jgi:site-specific recombinase XerD
VIDPRRVGEPADWPRNPVAATKAPNTLRGYRADWSDFAAWCVRSGAAALPAQGTTVADYVAHLAEEGRKASTIRRRLSAIGEAHRAAGLAAPTTAPEVREAWGRVRRAVGTAETGKTPVLVDDLRRIVATLPSTPLGVRDHALLLLGFAGAFRRSELVGLDLADLRDTADGLVVTVRRGQADEGLPRREVGIPYGSAPRTCPIRAVRAWLEVLAPDSRDHDGGVPLFRRVDRHGRIHPGRLSDRAVALVVKRYARAAGLDPDLYAGHSLRAGLATSAAAADVPERVIALQTGHRSMAVLRRYVDAAPLVHENAAARVGL